METMTTTSPTSTSATHFSESLTTTSSTTAAAPLGTLHPDPSLGQPVIDTTQGSKIIAPSETNPGQGDESKQEPLKGQGDDGAAPAPNFRVEGSGHGDSSVTVATGGTVSVSGSLMDESVSIGSGTTNGGSFPSGSEEMPLSLISWYSEPGEQTHAHGECCRSNHSSTATLITRDTSSEEKENKTPGGRGAEAKTGGPSSQTQSSGSGAGAAAQQPLLSKGTRARMQQVQVQQQKQKICPSVSQGTECPRCARRSKSGTTTPAAPSRTPRRLIHVPTSASGATPSSSVERKPIKSILKSDSRGSGSGSDKQSSMDSLGSSSGGPTMTRSDTGPRARAKFNLSDSISSESVSASYPEDRMISKLKRIEKYATVRLKQRPRVGPCENGSGEPGVPSDLMSKSMTYLEEHKCVGGGDSGSGPNSLLTLRRQGSLRSTSSSGGTTRKTSPMWEPPSTRTSALRLQKMQETKAGKQRSSNPFMVNQQQHRHHSSHHGSGSSHNSHNSGSGDSIHNANSSGLFSTSTPLKGNMSKEKHFGAKLFSKISSVMSQTTSSAMKRLRQDRGVQTEMMMIGVGEGGRSSPVLQLSPEPPITGEGGLGGWDHAEQVKHLDSLVERYKKKALQFQMDYETLSAVNKEMKKQMQEVQIETTEMIDFLQAEKSTLAETLAETELEAKKLRDQIEGVKRESESRCSSLVRLSEQHKQEALKSLALLNRLETHSKAELQQQRVHLTQGTSAIQQMKQRVLTMIEILLKTYKVPHERISSPGGSGTGMGVGLDETELSHSLLLPLIKSLSNAFQVPLLQQQSQAPLLPPSSGELEKLTTASPSPGIPILPSNTSASTSANVSPYSSPPTAAALLTAGGGRGNNSFQNLNQAILERQEAERLGLEGISPGSTTSPDDDYILLGQEINELQAALGKLVSVIRVIVIHCDQRVSSVASNILQVLKSSETDKLGGMAGDMDSAAMAHVQKSLEAWTLADQQGKVNNSSASSSSTLLNGSGPSHK